MQDIQNIPNPDVNSGTENDGFGNHSDVDQLPDSNDSDNIPLPPDEPQPAPVEEPPETEGEKIDEDNPNPGMIV